MRPDRQKMTLFLTLFPMLLCDFRKFIPEISILAGGTDI